ncbi:hypothetical protein PHYSODRAFT_532735, partial [Phytophthora sojae]
IFRVFRSIGKLIADQANWIPLFHWDETHMKRLNCNGVCVLVIGKDGVYY